MTENSNKKDTILYVTEEDLAKPNDDPQQAYNEDTGMLPLPMSLINYFNE